MNWYFFIMSCVSIYMSTKANITSLRKNLAQSLSKSINLVAFHPIGAYSKGKNRKTFRFPSMRISASMSNGRVLPDPIVRAETKPKVCPNSMIARTAYQQQPNWDPRRYFGFNHAMNVRRWMQWKNKIWSWPYCSLLLLTNLVEVRIRSIPASFIIFFWLLASEAARFEPRCRYRSRTSKGCRFKNGTTKSPLQRAFNATLAFRIPSYAYRYVVKSPLLSSGFSIQLGRFLEGWESERKKDANAKERRDNRPAGVVSSLRRVCVFFRWFSPPSMCTTWRGKLNFLGVLLRVKCTLWAEHNARHAYFRGLCKAESRRRYRDIRLQHGDI